MVPVEIKDKSVVGKRIIKDLRCHRGIVNFEEVNTIPEGYITGEEFRQRAIIKVNKFCDKHGIL